MLKPCLTVNGDWLHSVIRHRAIGGLICLERGVGVLQFGIEGRGIVAARLDALTAGAQGEMPHSGGNGACPSATTPSPVTLAEVLSRVPSRQGPGSAGRRGPFPGSRRPALPGPTREGTRDGASASVTGEGVVALGQAPRAPTASSSSRAATIPRPSIPNCDTPTPLSKQINPPIVRWRITLCSQSPFTVRHGLSIQGL